MKVLLITCNTPTPSTPMLGVTAIATYLESHGHTCRIFDDAPYMLDIADDSIDPREKIRTVGKTEDYEAYTLPHMQRVHELLNEVAKFEPKMVGVSTTEASYYNALEYLGAVKQRFPNIVTVLGGAFGLSSPEFVLRNDFVDLVCIGEGEPIALDLCQRIEESRELWDTPGMAARNPNGEVVRNRLPPLINVNDLPPLRYDFYNERRLYRPIGGKYRRTLPLEISRGCMYPCTFCNSPLLNTHFSEAGRYYRTKSPAALDECLDFTTKNYAPEYFFFISETFLAMKKGYLEAFVDVYGKYSVPFWMNTRPETVSDDKISVLAKVGLQSVSVGIESGNMEYRSKMLKRTYSNDLAIEAFDTLHRFGIRTTANIIIGLPEETREMVFDSIRLIKAIQPDSIGLGIFQPFKGNELYKLCVDKGYHDPDAVIDHTIFQPSLTTGTIETEELVDLHMKFALYTKADERHWPEIDKLDLKTEAGLQRFERMHDDLVTGRKGSINTELTA
jgi:anaerobic magnesium-protoporphyrin IX monomethyl ester cyclase